MSALWAPSPEVSPVRHALPLLEAYKRIGNPVAVRGLTLGALLDWPGCEWPAIPQLAVPASRRDPGTDVADVRRVQRWDRLVIDEGPYGLPILSPLDGVITVAPYLDDGAFHILLHELVFSGRLVLAELLARRRTGLPGSALISRVGGLYQQGIDSPGELRTFNLFSSYGLAPDHLNVSVLTPSGLVGPFDGLDDIGSGYEYDGIDHVDDRHLITDPWKNRRAEGAQLEIVRFISPDVNARVPALEGWLATRARAALIVRPAPLQIVHQKDRSCPCGHRPG